MWKQLVISGNKFNYEVSDNGKVRNILTGHVLKPKTTKKGYLELNIHNRNIGFKKTMKVHRLVSMVYLPNPNNLPQVNHKNGIKHDNRVENLEWCTNRENSNHAVIHGLKKAPIGENSGKSKYSNEQIREACRLLEKGVSYSEINESTGVDRVTLSAVRLGKCWTHISKNFDFKKNMKRDTHGVVQMYNSIDRAILNGLSKNIIISVLLEFMDKNRAENLYKFRKAAIENKESRVLCDAYFDTGVEIFSKYIGSEEPEIWKRVVVDGEELEYEISNYGQLRNIKNGGIMSHYDTDGYQWNQLFVKSKNKYLPFRIHKLVASAFLPNTLNESVVLHINGNRRDNRVGNLKWCSSKEKFNKDQEKGLRDTKHGTDSHFAKYDEQSIRRVCELLESNSKTYQEISLETGVRVGTINGIRIGRQWAHISKDYNFYDRRK